METLEHELRAVIARRLDNAGSREILAIASALCNGHEPAKIAPTAPVAGKRFEIESDTVLDRATGLQWSRDNVAGGRMNWKAAQEACTKLALGGHSDWRLPTIRELLTIVDYERHEPAIDTEAFKCESAWYWTSTPAASSPSGLAWVVYFSGGFSSWFNLDYDFYVRAVRASQSLDLWHVR